MGLENFFEVDYVDQASYDNLRKISSVVDGLKNSNRKVIHTVLDKKITELLKVQQLSSKASEYTDYLHGSLDGVIVSLGQGYVGTNQLPLLTSKGNFGTRLIPEASASRYIFAKGSPILPYLFIKEDRETLHHQVFEGESIEPRYFVPTLPMLLINGNRGVSSGFSQLIQPRNVKDILEILALRLSGKSNNFEAIDSKSLYVEGFNGYIYRDTETHGFRWIIEGSFEIGKGKVIIHELPLGTTLKDYLDVLDELKENKKIKGYKDGCSGDSFKFEVMFAPDVLNGYDHESLIKLLKLRTSITENFTALSENNKILELEKPSQILERFYSVKLEHTNIRKKLVLDDLKSSVTKKSEQFRFIGMVVSGELNLKELKTDQVKDFLESNNFVKFDGGFQYLLGMPLQSIQKDKMDALKSEIEELNKDIKELEKTTPEQIWLKDIQNLVKALK